jgi:hypothetical protein
VNIQYVTELIQMKQMYVLEMEIVLHQIIVIVKQVIFMKIVNIQFVMELLQMKQMFVIQEVNVFHQIIVFVI